MAEKCHCSCRYQATYGNSPERMAHSREGMPSNAVIDGNEKKYRSGIK
jgi:hypothetical protein